jgi:predicted nucleic-acid-binding protein
MRAIDTNVLVRLIARDDAKQVDAAEAFIVGGAWVSQIVLVETIWVLSTVLNLTPARIATVVDMLLDHERLTLQDADIVTRALGYFRKRPALGFSDCLVLASAHKAGHLPLGTFDRDLSRLPDTQRLS